jgi:hypothetical protein
MASLLICTTGTRLSFSGHHSPSFPIIPRPGFAAGQHPILLDEVKNALWSLAQITPTLPTSVIRYSAAIYERVLEALEAFSNTSPVIFSLKSLLKSRLAESLLYGSDSSSQGQFPPLRHPSLPTATAIAVPPEFLEAQVVDSPESGFSEDIADPFQQVLQSRIIEAKLGFVAEFLDGMGPDFIPYRADETHYLCDNIPTPDAKFTKPIKIDLPLEYAVFSILAGQIMQICSTRSLNHISMQDFTRWLQMPLSIPDLAMRGSGIRPLVPKFRRHSRITLE